MIKSVTVSLVKRNLASDTLMTELSMWNEKGKMTVRERAHEASILGMLKVLKGNPDRYGLSVYDGKGAWPPRTVEFYRIILQMKKLRPKEEKHIGKCVHGYDAALLFREEVFRWSLPCL